STRRPRVMRGRGPAPPPRGCPSDKLARGRSAYGPRPTVPTLLAAGPGSARGSLIAKKPLSEQPLAPRSRDEGVTGQAEHDQRHEDALVGVPGRQVHRERAQRKQFTGKTLRCKGEQSEPGEDEDAQSAPQSVPKEVQGVASRARI